MQELVRRYLKENGFKPIGNDGAFESIVINEKGFMNDSFSDRRQLALIRAQWGDLLENVTDMSIIISPVEGDEFDVTLSWFVEDDDTHSKKGHCSSIGGNDLYGLVSQAIVLADVEQ